MAGAVFERGPITFEAAEDVTARRLVTLTENGVKHAAADGEVFGAVQTSGSKAVDRSVNDLSRGFPSHVAVFFGPAAVKLEFDGAADGFKLGTKVFAAADGKVSASGTKPVGVVVRPVNGKFVTVVLATPVV